MLLSELSFYKAAMLCARLGISDNHVFGQTDHLLITVRREFDPGSLKLAEWLDVRRTFGRSQEPPDILKETTYRDCVEWSFRPATGMVEITMYDGDPMFGQREGPRCKWKLFVSEKMPETRAHLMPLLLSQIKQAAVKEYEKRLAKQREEAIYEIVKGYLK